MLFAFSITSEEFHQIWKGPLQTGLGFYFLLVMAMNLGFAAYYFRVEKQKSAGLAWTLVSGVHFVFALAYLAHASWQLPAGLKDFIDVLMGPVIYSTLSVVGFFAFLQFRRTFTNPHVAWGLLNATLLFVGLAMSDKDFYSIAAKEDNAPIPLLIFSVGFFTWLAMRRSVINDDRMAKGEPPLEKLEDEKVLVWPDLVYTELIAMIICTTILIVWGILLKAPLEDPATTAKAPNPSKAPWYFLGLQEMLVYFDPWMAGVVLPTMIIVGLVAMPYIDFNQKGNGYYTYTQRRFAIVTFLFGFLVMWVTLIVLGTILRGPNWNFFGPFATWDPHISPPLDNVNLARIFWLDIFGTDPEGLSPLMRELPGIVVLLFYFMLLPPLLAKTIFKTFFVRMGFIRFFVLVTLLQFMALLPIKMVLRWTLNLKYIVAFPEVFFNI